MNSNSYQSFDLSFHTFQNFFMCKKFRHPISLIFSKVHHSSFTWGSFYTRNLNFQFAPISIKIGVYLFLNCWLRIWSDFQNYLMFETFTCELFYFYLKVYLRSFSKTYIMAMNKKYRITKIYFFVNISNRVFTHFFVSHQVMCQLVIIYHIIINIEKCILSNKHLFKNWKRQTKSNVLIELENIQVYSCWNINLVIPSYKHTRIIRLFCPNLK